MDINDLKKFNKIKELANNGDEKAKDFLFNFMEMDDKQANEYLLSVDTDSDYKGIIETLINDENEAIDGYDKAIKYAVNVGLPFDKLEKIKNDEIEHIEILKGLLSDGNKD